MTSVAFALPRRSMSDRARGKAPRAARVLDVVAAAPRSVRPGHVARPRRRARSAVRATTWELRSFVGASAAIAVAFVLALAYLAGSTGVASVGYEAQRLQAERDELRRQNALLEIDLAKLDSPARIEAGAKRLGLVRMAFVPVVPAAPLTARR